MDKRYQVFISSTYFDLKEERQEVMQALLELDCIPSGMELFPATNDDQWTLIKKVIDDCDYYIIILGGRYGSIGPEGISYTEMEYKYALEAGKPIISFLHKDPGEISSNKTEQAEEGKKKLQAFRQLVQKKLVKFWSNPAELGSMVSRSLVQLIKNNPAVGWVRADNVPSEGASQELLRLKNLVEELEGKLKSARTQAPTGTDSLAQGEDDFTIHYHFTARTARQSTYGHEEEEFDSETTITWNTIFSFVSPLMIDEASEQEIRVMLNEVIRQRELPLLAEDEDFKTASALLYFKIFDEDFQTIKIQLRSLGLITKRERNKSVKDKETYWTLTPYGDSVMSRLRAVRRSI